MRLFKNIILVFVLVFVAGAAFGFGDLREGVFDIVKSGYAQLEQFLDVKESASDPSAPSAGYRRIFAKEGKFYQIDSASAVEEIGAGGGGGGDIQSIIQSGDNYSVANSTLTGGATAIVTDTVVQYTTGTLATSYFVFEDVALILDKDTQGVFFHAAISGVEADVAECFVYDGTDVVSQGVKLSGVSGDNLEYSIPVIIPDPIVTGLRVRCNQLTTTAATTIDVSKIQWTTSIYALINLVENTNSFSARIVNNGAASINSQSSIDNPAIASVNRSALGVVDITFTSGFFSVAPAVTASPELIESLFYSNLSTTGVTISTRNEVGVSFDRNFSIDIDRQGADVAPPQSGWANSAEMDRSAFEWPQYDISAEVTPSNGSMRFATARPFQTNDGVWKVELSLSALRSSSLTGIGFNVAGVTFAKSEAMATGWSANGRGGNASTTGGTNGILASTTIASSDYVVTGTVELTGKPTWATNSGTAVPTVINAPVAVMYPTETKILSANVSGTQDATALTFTGLDVGSEYTVEGQIDIYASSATTAIEFRSVIGGAGELYARPKIFIPSTALRVSQPLGFKFTATSASMYVRLVGTTLYGDNTKGSTFIQLTRSTEDSGFIALDKTKVSEYANRYSETEKECGLDEISGKTVFCRTIYFASDVTVTNATYLNLGTAITPVDAINYASQAWLITRRVDAGTSISWAEYRKDTGYVAVVAGGGYKIGAGTKILLKYTKD